MKSDTRQIILIRASELFYSEGFNNTGMEKITEVCGIRKPSLYHHFGSKNELGLEYLEYKAESLFAMLTALLKRSKSFGAYLNAWASAYIVLARRREFAGCPFTAFASELDPFEREFFSKRLQKMEKDWLAFQEEAIRKFHGRANASTLAQRLLVIHTGCVMLFRASRDMRYLRQLKVEFNRFCAEEGL